MKKGSVIRVKNDPRNATPRFTSGANSAVMSKFASVCSMEATNARMSASVFGARPSVFTHASMFANASGSDCRNAAACVVTTPRNATISVITTAKNTTIVSRVAMPRGTRRADSHVTIGSRRKARIRPMMNTNIPSPTAARTAIVSSVANTATIPAALGTRSRGKPDAAGGMADGVVIEGASGVTDVGSGKGAIQARAEADVPVGGVEELVEQPEAGEDEPPGEQDGLAAQRADGAAREVARLEPSEDEEPARDDEGGPTERRQGRDEQQGSVHGDREHDQRDAADDPGDERQEPRIEPERHQEACADRRADAEREDQDRGPKPQRRGDGQRDAQRKARGPARGGREEAVAEDGLYALGAEQHAGDEGPQRQEQVEQPGAVHRDEGTDEQPDDPEDHGIHVAVSP